MTKEKKLSAGIQRFMEQQKREDEEKAARERQKKLEMLARRDPKEQRKIDKALKVIKSSKKFYTGDSNLDENTSVTLCENEQPDEDDYGFASATSDQFHKKLMEKYQKLPEEKKFASSGKHKAMSKEEMQRTKDRVKSAFTTPEDEQHHFKQGHKQRNSIIKSRIEKSSRDHATAYSVPQDKKNIDKPKPKLRPAPVVNFQELLKLAEQKQHEDIVIDVPTKKEPERPLTSKEKRELEELEAARKAKMKPNRIPKLGAIPKLGDSLKHDKNNNEGASIKKPPVTQSRPTGPQSKPLIRSQDSSDLQRRPLNGSSSSSNSASKLRDALQKTNGSSQKPSPPAAAKSTIINQRMPTKPVDRAPAVKPKDSQPRSLSAVQNSSSKIDKSRPSTSSMKAPEKAREFPPRDLMRTREFPPRDLKRPREFPPKDLMRPREFPPRDGKRMTQQQISRKRESNCKIPRRFANL